MAIHRFCCGKPEFPDLFPCDSCAVRLLPGEEPDKRDSVFRPWPFPPCRDYVSMAESHPNPASGLGQDASAITSESGGAA